MWSDLHSDAARRVARSRTFDEIAELYDRARRPPPEELFEDLFSIVALEPARTNVLEIGCGTGQATLPLARRGCRVVCVEMGPNLAQVARRNLAQFPRVEIVNARFEDWNPGGARFDLVFAANSWHWLDPESRYSKTAELLRPAGLLAFTVSRHAFPPGFDPFFADIQDCYEAIGVGRLSWPPPAPEDLPDARSEIEQSGHFEVVKVARYLRVEEFNADQHVALMSTASDHRLLEPAKRERLFADMRRLIDTRPGGRIRKHELTILHVARRRPGGIEEASCR